MRWILSHIAHYPLYGITFLLAYLVGDSMYGTIPALTGNAFNDQLLSRGGHYAHLYNTYFRHQSPDYVPGAGFVAVTQAAGER